MRVFAAFVLLGFTGVAALSGEDVASRAREFESNGDALGARTLLRHAVRSAPDDTESLIAYAEFLDEHRDPEAREVYEKLLSLLPRSGANEKRVSVARRLVILDLLAEDRTAAVRHLKEYRAAGGAALTRPAPPDKHSSEVETRPAIDIPGPIRSFARMAALTPDLNPDDILPALARNVITNGYQAISGNEALDQTEYLKLVIRYLSQARELEKLAGAGKTIQIESCDSSRTADLLRILGYRMRGGCGSDLVLETVNASRAFLTVDSGFPLAQLEERLRTNRPFVYDYKPSKIPVLFGPDYWLASSEKQSGEFIDVFLADPAICRLYLGMSKLDPETADAMRKQIPVQRVRAFAHVLDFFGSMFEIRNGRALVPGAPQSTQAWTDLVGVSPDRGAAFFERLISKDDGWMAGYFDALARINGPLAAYLTEPARMKRFYLALRGRVTSPGPARPVFRSNTDLMLLTTRLRLDASGRPHVPGSLHIWKGLFVNHPRGKYDAKLSKAASNWRDSDDVVEALFGLCRRSVENEPLKIFMALSDVDRERATPLQPDTVDRLARDYHRMGAQYSIFAEAPSLSDDTIIRVLDTEEAVSSIRDTALRADTAGTLQGLIAAWQIFVRQGSISAREADYTLAVLLEPFARIHNARDMFDGGRAGVATLLKAAHLDPAASPQDAMVDLLAGGPGTSDPETHMLVVQDMMRIFEAQHLISLKDLFDLDDNLRAVAKGGNLNVQLVNRLGALISNVQTPRATLSGVEKNAFSFGYWTDHHIDVERKLNLKALIDKSGNDAAKLSEIRGLLTPFLRDTLVGFDYMHYAPPGAQLLLTNPLFVRSHDFIGIMGGQQLWRGSEVYGSGWPSSAGGRLVGSLVNLPYALAEAEQNFLVPQREQALIWGDLVPQMLLSAKVPRWWNVTGGQLHWVGLHIRYAESVLAESALDPALREQVMGIFETQAVPARVYRIRKLIEAGDIQAAVEDVTPSEMFVLTKDLLAARKDDPDNIAREIHRMAASQPDRINYRTISHAFGTPKPTLANSYEPELLGLRTFPALMGYSSRIMAESWESNLLYYAALADEMNLPPSQLNVLVPEWTKKTVERIFATHLEDWPALLRSLHTVGDDVRQRARKQMAAEQKAAL